MKRVIVHPLYLLLCAVVAGQTAGAVEGTTRESVSAVPFPGSGASATNVTDQPTASQVAPAAYALDDKHKLLPGDRVSFQILEDRTNAIPLLVAESSELDIPYIGRMSVAGKTCKELASEVKMRLEQDYYYRATVIIGLDALAKVLGRVYVWGPVRTQGPIEIPANETFTASKAILRAGGFGDFANKKEVSFS